jgi:3',5'-cyclic AMP phosphodiesterase CpdA
MRIVQISDTHLTHMEGVTNENFQKLVDFVNDVLKPDLVINTGDLVILSPDSDADRECARAAHERFAAPVRIVPGNHDVGMTGDEPWMGIATTTKRITNFRDGFGTDRFIELPDSTWALIGFNSELLSTGLPEETEQWTWLERIANEVRGRCVALFLHRPLWSPMPDVTDHEIAVHDADRDRILQIFSDSCLKLVASGHLHRFIADQHDETLTISAPSSAFIVKGGSLGLNQLGVVEYRIEGEQIEAYFRSVPTLVEDEPFGLAAFSETLASIEQSRGAVV